SVNAVAADPSDLLPVVPSAANAIVVIDVEALLATELSKRHHWDDKATLEYAQRPVLVPAESSAVAIAASLDFNAELSPRWQVGIAQMTKRFEIPSIARWEGGYADRIAGSAAAWSPVNCYIVELPGQLLGIISPADRQSVARWLELQDQGAPRRVSQYLQDAARQVSNKTQLVMAIDAQQAIAPHRLKELTDHSEILFKEPRQADDVRTQLAALVGVTLKVSVTTHAEGELRIDFTTGPKNGPLVKPLLIETLDRFDLHLEELEQWSAKVDGNSLVLSGRFSPEGLRRVGSLLQLPTAKFSDLSDAAPAEPGSDDCTLRSQQYFHAVSALIDDLNKTLKSNRDNHAVWMERYGQKVDALPILNVDDELLDWGASVGETFRTMALAQRSSGIRQGVRKSSVYGNYDYGNGYYGARPVANEKGEITRQEAARASKVRFESWKELEDSRAEIRRTMTKKYGVEF
ncbi:MAG: hypothetical protein KDA75_01345, partial [Planctomycetaceae bacterium]|nr:hypothetical protein [Planctomycetaceae bacterium]